MNNAISASVRAFTPLWKMAVSLEEIIEGRFRSPKTAEDESNLSKESIGKSTVPKDKERKKERKKVFRLARLYIF